MADLAAGTIKSTTLEGALLEVAQLLNSAEQAFIPAEGIQKQNRVQVSVNADTNTATVTANLPLALGVSATGVIQLTVEEYC